MDGAVRIGIVGTGVIAREHARAIAMIPNDAILVAAADVLPERRADFGNVFQNSRLYASAAEVIADPDIDLVAITTPPAAHEEPAVAALDGGKYVFCEKPLAHRSPALPASWKLTRGTRGAWRSAIRFITTHRFAASCGCARTNGSGIFNRPSSSGTATFRTRRPAKPGGGEHGTSRAVACF